MENKDKILQIIDMNVNRACEGLRVVEDFARVQNWDDLAKKISRIRHSIREHLNELDASLLNSRNISKDEEYNQTYSAHKTLYSLLMANFKRTGEAIRNLEEYSRLEAKSDSISFFRKCRYKSYESENEFSKNYYLRYLRNELYPILSSNYCQNAKKLGHHHYKLVQYRNKKGSLKEKEADVSLIKDFYKRKEVLLIINDDIQLAWKTKSIGLHLGQEDLKKNIHQWSSLRGVFPIIGISCSDEREVIAAISLKPDYIGIGAVWQTKNKPDAKVMGVESAARLFNKYNPLIPVFLIGGFTIPRIKEIKKLCPDFKVFSGIDIFVDAQDIGERKRKIVNSLT